MFKLAMFNLVKPLKLAALALAVGCSTVSGAAHADDKVTLFLGFTPEPETGGFMQAFATGLYKKAGLDVEIKFGNPQAAPGASMAAGKIDFSASPGSIALNAVREGVPRVVVAAIFQKEVRILMAHKGAGNDTLEQMKGKPILVAATGRGTFWPFLAAKYGFTDDQLRPYTGSQAPFLNSKNAIEQGYITSEPFLVRTAGADPVYVALADHGYEGYASTILTSNKLIETNPAMVQRFVDATIEGWYDFLYGNPAPAIKYLQSANPDITDERVAYAIKVIKDNGIVDSGDAKKLGIGAMTDERWARIIKQQQDFKILPTDVDFRKAYTLQFVNKQVGMKK
ncbi:ABC transporter substrate-binding protein [soil metagenome]